MASKQAKRKDCVVNGKLLALLIVQHWILEHDRAFIVISESALFGGGVSLEIGQGCCKWLGGGCIVSSPLLRRDHSRPGGMLNITYTAMRDGEDGEGGSGN
jgi:hypothetical protein